MQRDMNMDGCASQMTIIMGRQKSIASMQALESIVISLGLFSVLALSCAMYVVCVSSYGDWESLNISVRQSSMSGTFDRDCVPVTGAVPIRTVRQLLMLSLSSDRTAWLSCSVEQPHET